MSALSAAAMALHVLGAVTWVGGIFFAYVVLRPSLAAFDPPQRLQIWSAVFTRFFGWVWGAVVLLLATGYIQLFGVLGGFRTAGLHVHAMHVLGLVMIGLFVFLYFAPYARFRTAVAATDWPRAGAELAVIRRIVGANLLLGLVTVAVGSSGRFWA